eukprot:Nk52_evm91s158 gene=Nk52_evmTU91s158
MLSSRLINNQQLSAVAVSRSVSVSRVCTARLFHYWGNSSSSKHSTASSSASSSSSPSLSSCISTMFKSLPAQNNSTPATRSYCAAADTAPPKQYDPKLTAIVEEISKLTLLEVADLNACLKEKLNIADAPMMSFAGAAPGAAAGGAASEEEDKPAEQTAFTVKLEAVDAAQRVKVIREVKAIMPDMNLVQAKKFVENLPAVLKEDMSKEQAEELVKTLSAVGAKCVIE